MTTQQNTDRLIASQLMLMNEAADYMRRPIGTLRDWRLKNFGPRSVRIGGRIYYRRSDLDAFIAAQFGDETR